MLNTITTGAQQLSFLYTFTNIHIFLLEEPLCQRIIYILLVVRRQQKPICPTLLSFRITGVLKTGPRFIFGSHTTAAVESYAKATVARTQ